MMPKAVPMLSQILTSRAHDPAPLNRAAAAVKTMGIAASRRDCGASLVALSSTLRNQNRARVSG